MDETMKTEQQVKTQPKQESAWEALDASITQFVHVLEEVEPIIQRREGLRRFVEAELARVQQREE